MRSTSARPGLVALLSVGLVCGCSRDSGPAAGASGGAGHGSGGAGGSTGNGGAAVGSGGAGHGSGGAGGRPDGGPPTGDPTAALDACFAGLRALATFNNQIATKRSADGRYLMRLALEYPPGSVGTSGTVPWFPIRFALVTPQAQLCLQDETALRAAYRGSRHNCSDTLTVSDGGVTYQLEHPDTTPEHPDTLLSVGGAAPVTLTTVTCTRKPGDQCLSGGPCN